MAKRLKTLNLCDLSVERLNKSPIGQSAFARMAILGHDRLKRENVDLQREHAEERVRMDVQQARDEDAIRLLANLVREIYLYPKEATERIEKVMQIDDEMRDWYRKEELSGRGVKWFLHRCRAVVAGVRL